MNHCYLGIGFLQVIVWRLGGGQTVKTCLFCSGGFRKMSAAKSHQLTPTGPDVPEINRNKHLSSGAQYARLTACVLWVCLFFRLKSLIDFSFWKDSLQEPLCVKLSFFPLFSFFTKNKTWHYKPLPDQNFCVKSASWWTRVLGQSRRAIRQHQTRQL